MRTTLAVVAAVLATAPVWAADPGPTLEVRVRAIDDLLPVAEYLGGLAGQEEQAKQGVAVVRAFAGKKGLEGVDTKRPIGLYARLTPAVADSPVVLLVPVADEPAFLNLLATRLKLDPKKGDDGVYAVKVPNVPPTVYFRFHKGYACGTVHTKASLDPDRLPDPAAFLASDDPALAAVVVHLDRVPAEVRKTFLGQMELQLADRKKGYEGKGKAERLGYEIGSEAAFRAVRTAAEDGAAASLRLVVDPKTYELTAEFALTAKDGSGLRSMLAEAGRRPSAAREAAAAKNPVVAVAARFELPDWLKKPVAEAVDFVITDALDKAKPDDRPAAEKVFDALAPTLKAGVADLAVGLSGTPGALKLAAAVKMTDGKAVEAVAKEFAPFLPSDKVALKTDVTEAGGLNLHTLRLPAPEVKALFGTDTFWLGTSADRLQVTAGGGEAAAKTLAAAGPSPGDLFRAELAVVRLLGLVEQGLPADEQKRLAGEVFGDAGADGRDTAVFAVTAGEKLAVRLTVKGKAVRYAVLVDQAKKAK
jgi:hypothetical protein